MFAESYVFDKQSLPPFHCGPRQLHRQAMSPAGASLIPKLRLQFAEFLNKSSPKRLRILSSSTCVGLRYGLITFFIRSFSGKQRITNFGQALVITPQPSRDADLPTSQPTRLNPHPTVGFATFLRHSSCQTNITKYRNINLLSIDYAFRPHLRIRLTLGGVTWPRNP